MCMFESRQEDVKFVLPRFVTQPTADTHPFEHRCSVCLLKVLAIFAPAQVYITCWNSYAAAAGNARLP